MTFAEELRDLVAEYQPQCLQRQLDAIAIRMRNIAKQGIRYALISPGDYPLVDAFTLQKWLVEQGFNEKALEVERIDKWTYEWRINLLYEPPKRYKDLV